ncbi:MAG: chemotaxis protein CheW [Spirochaetaceae bacterium]
MSEELTNQYLTFYLDKEEYALSVTRVQEVLELIEPSRLPQMPYYMEGIINVRDSVLPVVDMRRRFGLEEVDRTVDSAILVMELSPAEEKDEATTVGCLVDAVDAVVEIEPTQIEAPPEIGTSVDSGFLEGIAKSDERFVMILDPNALFNRREIERAGSTYAPAAGR